MVCDICHQRQATIVWTVVVNDKRTELNLCEVCASKKGLIDQINKFMNFKDFLPLVSPGKDVENTRCPNCGASYGDFQNTAKFGCQECYIVFEEALTTLMQKVHGNDYHVGKTAEIFKPYKKSASENKSTEIQKLNEQLKKAIEKEDYEEAARIRDKLKKWKI